MRKSTAGSECSTEGGSGTPEHSDDYKELLEKHEVVKAENSRLRKELADVRNFQEKEREAHRLV